MGRITLVLAVTLALTPVSLTAEAEPVDWEMASRIRHEGFHNSEVMETLEHLTDVIGPSHA